MQNSRIKQTLLILIHISVTPDYAGQVALSSANTPVTQCGILHLFYIDWFVSNFRNPARNKHKMLLLFWPKKFIGFYYLINLHYLNHTNGYSSTTF
jgi:hypothetical protein